MSSFGSGIAITGQLLDVNDVNQYAVTLQAGHTYDFFMGGDANGNPAYIHDPKLTIAGLGQTASDNDSGDGLNAHLRFTPTTTGAYTLSAEGLGADGAGKYWVTVNSASFGYDLADQVSTVGGYNQIVAVGDTIESRIGSAEDSDVVKVYLVAGNNYTIDARGTDTYGELADAQLSLLNAAGTVLMSDDNSGAGNDARITMTPFTSGFYYLKVDGKGDSTGKYELQVSAPHADIVPGDHTTIYDVKLDTYVKGTLENVGDQDAYKVQLTEGLTYGCFLGDEEFLWDTHLELRDSNGVVVAENDNAGTANGNSFFVYTPAESGTFYLVASGVGGDTGDYLLSMSLYGETRPPLQVVSAQDGLSGETIFGDIVEDLITGGAGDDTMNGRGGNDTMNGGGGNDYVFGGFDGHYDQLFGGNGNDTLVGGEGKDTMTGGSGNDDYYVDDAGDAVVENAGGGTDTVYSTVNHTLSANVENLVLQDGALSGAGNGLANTITGNGAANLLGGLGGTDTLNGGAGADTMTGGTENDLYMIDDVGDALVELAGGGTDVVWSTITHTLVNNVERVWLLGADAINAAGNAADNVLAGNDAANALNGLLGNDTINGNLGIDTIAGSGGKDTLYGGGGPDTFRYYATGDSGPAVNQRDAIMDFEAGDKIELSPIDAKVSVAGDQAFTFVANFTGVAGQVQWDQTGAHDFLVSGDVNGDAVADFAIEVHGGAALNQIQAGDFLL